MPVFRPRAGLALVFIPASLLAQPVPTDDAVVVTATRSEQRLRDAIPHTTVLTQKDIRDSQAVDLPTLLRMEAGFEMTQNGGIGGNSSIFMRGGRSAQALILVDGIRMEDSGFGTTAIQHILLDEVERIEIARGNVSSLYGSGAIGGVVQVFTKRGRGAPAPYGDLTLGSRNTSKLRAGYGGQVSDTTFNLTATRFDTKGFSAMDASVAPLANPDPDGYRNDSVTGSISQRLSQRHELGASFLQARGRADLDGNTAFLGDTPTTQHRINQDLGMLQAYWEARLVEAWKSRLTAGQGTDYRTEYRDGAYDNNSNTRNRQVIWDNEVQVASQHRVTLGLESLRQELANGGVFGLGEQRREVEIARLGYLGRLGPNSLQVNWRADDYSDFGKADTYYLGYGLDLTDAWRLTAASSTAFRAPTFQDLYGFGGNPLLKPERARTKEIGMQWAQGPQRLRVVAFDTEYEDAISFDLLTFTAANVRKASVQGIETSYSGAFAGFDLRASLTFQDPIEQEPGGQEEQAIRRAKRFGSVTVYRSMGAWRLGGQLLASASRPDADINTFAGVREAGYTVVHLIARYQISKGLFVAARVENALDEEYRVVNGFNTPPRGVFIIAGWQP